MKWSIIFLVFTFQLGAQSFDARNVDENEDPNEEHYLNELLESIFQPFDLKNADSSQLDSRGFSQVAISAILKWQGESGTKHAIKTLQKGLSEQDINLLDRLTWKGNHGKVLTLRQSLHSSASLNGWRILQKARVGSRWGELMYLIEQDPGEARLSDHSILTFASNLIPGFTQVILGDFHVRWGAGIILNQPGFRANLNPGSLLVKSQLAITPHYSSRETDYFRGVAAKWALSRVNGAIFLSNREVIGVQSEAGFKEDSDGIHPAGKQFQTSSERMAGVAGNYDIGSFRCFGAIILNSQISLTSQCEFGVTWQINDSQVVQVFTGLTGIQGGRSVLVWSYSSNPVILSIQYRKYRSRIPMSSGFVFTMLGTDAINESGIVARLQIKPAKKVLFRYALDTGFSAKLNSLTQSNRIVQHKTQVILRQVKREWQLDLSLKHSGPVTPNDIWHDQVSYARITKIAISLDQVIGSNFQYRLNLKTAKSPSNKSLLIQQRLLINTFPLKASIGFVRFIVPDFALRLSIYESGLLESFSFFTAYQDGQRWFLYLKRRFREQVDLELRLAHSHLDQEQMTAKQLDVSFQLSVVL